MPNTAEESIHESLKSNKSTFHSFPSLYATFFKSLTFILSSADAKSML